MPHLNDKSARCFLRALILFAVFLTFPVFAFAQKNSNAKKELATDFTSRVVLIPLDDRPATTQFAEMIGRIGNAQVILPPRQLLGTFITAGDSEGIAKWLREYDFSNVDAVILSADMLAYGGFMTSRLSTTPLDVALRRLEIIKELKHKNPRLPIYAFNVVRRVALSAFAANRAYRNKIARWSVLADETAQKPDDTKLKEEFQQLEREIPKAEIDDYLAVRRRNLQVNYAMLDLAKTGSVDKLLLLQDDAHPFGLHRRDQKALLERISKLGLSAEQAALYNGADEGANVLLSRVVLKKARFKPRVRVVYSSEAGRSHLGDFEDQPIETSVTRQLETSGAEIVANVDSADYTLYVNAPQQIEKDFQIFLAQLIADVKSGRRVAIADVLYKVWGGGDVRLVEALGREKLLDCVIGYASWGTPGNAIGTVVPQANMYVFARRQLSKNQALAKEVEAAQIKFLFHRWLGDYGYHVLVRPDVNKYARQDLKIETEEFDRPTYEKFNKIVVERMTTITQNFFDEHFKNRFYQTGKNANDGIVLREMQNLQIRLPWVRTFEIFMDYDFRFSVHKEVAAAKRTKQ
ncbi:MAG: DUF4127 family protein [Acidobacteriota bacterium]|nr:DUF4127 family protein [Acidobacteriota bacterium]